MDLRPSVVDPRAGGGGGLVGGYMQQARTPLFFAKYFKKPLKIGLKIMGAIFQNPGRPPLSSDPGAATGHYNFCLFFML